MVCGVDNLFVALLLGKFDDMYTLQSVGGEGTVLPNF